MKLKLEVDLTHSEGPPADMPYILQGLTEILAGTDFWVQDEDNADESGYTIESVKSLD